jgi:hypothetical protein
MTMIRRCPRCDAVIPHWQPVHLACFLQRSWLAWVISLLVLGGGSVALAYLVSSLLNR